VKKNASATAGGRSSPSIFHERPNGLAVFLNEPDSLSEIAAFGESECGQSCGHRVP
jgi:hypothetical protein